MEEVLEMGMKPEQDALSPQLLPAKPLEIQPFFFASVCSEFACTLSVQLITQPCPTCILPFAVGYVGVWDCGNDQALMLEGGLGAGLGTVHHSWKIDGS